MANFPTLGNKEDSSKYGLELEDVGIRSPMDGGYVLTRPRFTRKPRRTWKTGFTNISHLDKLTIEEFYNTHGTFKAFNYVTHFDEEIVNVRFKQPPQFKFAGWPSNPRWNIDEIILEEV